MTTHKPFKYTALKYRSAYDLGEQVNIGLLFVFPEEQRVEFLFPQHLQRLSQTFPKADINFVKQYLRAFKTQAARLSRNANLFSGFESENFLANEFLVKDATALFFSDWKTGEYRNADEVIFHYQNRYFSYYQNLDDDEGHNEKYLLAQANQAFARRAAEFQLFHKNILIRDARAEANFDFAWQNGSLNLVRTLGFDYKTREGILNKGHLWFGKLTYLRPKIEEKNAQIHFLLSQPRNPELFRYFQDAREILESLDIRKQFYTEAQISDYADHALETAQPLDETLFDARTF